MCCSVGRCVFRLCCVGRCLELVLCVELVRAGQLGASRPVVPLLPPRFAAAAEVSRACHCYYSCLPMAVLPGPCLGTCWDPFTQPHTACAVSPPGRVWIEDSTYTLHRPVVGAAVQPVEASCFAMLLAVVFTSQPSQACHPVSLCGCAEQHAGSLLGCQSTSTWWCLAQKQCKQPLRR